jgi:uncharacterized protein (TIGR02145 family)
METNLAYAGGGNNTYQDTMAAIPEGTALDYTTAYRYTPLNANDTSGYHKPVTTTNGASGANNSTANATAQYGYLYNYCAAMGGQTVNDDGTTNGACNSTSAVQPDQKVNPGNGTIYNICPAGWRLPMGGTTAAATNEFAKLNTAINNGSTSSPSGLFTNGLYMYSGGWDNGFNGQGSVGYYSSSTVYNTTVAYGLYFNSASVNLANVGNERYGYAVRCVAPAKEAKTGDDIQTITAKNCPVNRTRVVDARDGKTYWVRKIANTNGLADISADGRQTANGDPLCWMETNLAYAGGGTNTYGDTVTAIPEGTATDYTTAYRYTPLNANPTSGTTDPVTTTNGAAGVNNTTANATAQYGLLYNWCAAMNRQAVACQSAAATQPTQTINTRANQYNICPAGWRLPTGEPTTGEFARLNTAINDGVTNNPSGLFANGLYMYSGYWSNGDFGNQGSSSYYWSSTVGSTANAYALYIISTTGLIPASASNKQAGFAARCVAP